MVGLSAGPPRAAAGRLRPLREDDVTAVLDLNERHVELLAPMDRERLDQLRAWGGRVQVVEMVEVGGDVGTEIAGFVVTFRPGSPYDSENYQWFAQEYGGAYLYLDRIVVDDRFRRRGLAGLVYDAVEAEASQLGRLALEVNVDPPNQGSLAFHASRGYVEVGRRGDPGHVVCLMVRVLAG